MVAPVTSTGLILPEKVFCDQREEISFWACSDCGWKRSHRAGKGLEAEGKGRGLEWVGLGEVWGRGCPGAELGGHRGLGWGGVVMVAGRMGPL